MFHRLSKFDKILVTGPQRSGTRICAKMIAHDTGHGYVDELDIKMDSLYSFQALFSREKSVVIQCPVMCRHIHMFNMDNVAVVLMRRRVEDIVASQERIAWPWEKLELARYDRLDGVIAEVKYRFWDEYQKQRLEHAFEVEYDGLSKHPLWVTKDLRRKFSATQTSHSNQPYFGDQRVLPMQAGGTTSLGRLPEDSVILVKAFSHKILNITGRLIWDLCDGKHTRQEILLALRREFRDVPEEVLSADLDAFILGLASDDFLSLTFPASGEEK